MTNTSLKQVGKTRRSDAMTKTQIKKDLEKKTEAIVITAPMVAKAMQMRRSEAYALCDGCNYEKRGRSRFYYIDDVAERLAKRMMV